MEALGPVDQVDGAVGAGFVDGGGHDVTFTTRPPPDPVPV